MFQSIPFSLGALGLGGGELALIIAVFGLIFGSTIAIVAMYFQHQRQRLWHETARLALEKGQPVPLPAQKFESARDELRHHDLRGGLVMIAVGFGLYLFLLQLAPANAPGVAFVGAIPGFIGVALLAHAALSALLRGKKSDSAPPRS